MVVSVVAGATVEIGAWAGASYTGAGAGVVASGDGAGVIALFCIDPKPPTGAETVVGAAVGAGKATGDGAAVVGPVKVDWSMVE